MFCSRCRQPNPDVARFCTRCGAPLMAAPAPAHPAPPPSPAVAPSGPVPAVASPTAKGPASAGFFRRLIALLVDTLVVALLLALTTWIIGWIHEEVVTRTVLDPEGLIFERLNARFRLAGLASGLLLPLLYFVLLDWSIQGTPGKRLLGCRVANLAGQRVGLIRSTCRTLLKPLSAAPLLLGFLLAAFTRRKQALHDLLSGSVVLKRR